MAIANGTGGYQAGDGNINDVLFVPSAIPTAYTAGVTLAPADLFGGLVVYNSASTANLVLPTAALTDAAFSNARVGSSFDIALIALAAGVPTITVGTGWTLVGSAAGVASKSVLFKVVKTGDAAYNLYRTAG